MDNKPLPMDDLSSEVADPALSVQQPTLSVLLPTYCDGFRLGVQLTAILSQLTEDDELILLLDGSDELTRHVAGMFDGQHPALQIINNDLPSGVCRAYNRCAEAATKDWVLGASGNDEVQPGAIDAWRDAAQRWPEAKIMLGITHGCTPRLWKHETSHLAPCEMPAIWRTQGWSTPGAATFIRRDCWYPGYVLSHEWLADCFQSLILCWRHGCIDLHATISRVHRHEGAFSTGHEDEETHARCQEAIRRTWARPEYDDVRAMGTIFHDLCGWLGDKTYLRARLKADFYRLHGIRI